MLVVLVIFFTLVGGTSTAATKDIDCGAGGKAILHDDECQSGGGEPETRTPLLASESQCNETGETKKGDHILSQEGQRQEGARSQNNDKTKITSALSRARALKAPQAKRTLGGGELEGHDFWQQNEGLLKEARLEYGPKHVQLYQWAHDDNATASLFLHPHILSAAKRHHFAMSTKATSASSSSSFSFFSSLIQPTNVPHVYTFPLFTPNFCQLLLDELEHYESSGIPMRRPNGMNRRGFILEQLGLDSETFVQPLARTVLYPIMMELYALVGMIPSWENVAQDYAFTVQYENELDNNVDKVKDQQLAEHADASLITINICLEYEVDDNVAQRNHSSNNQKKTNNTVAESPLYFKQIRTLGGSDNNNNDEKTFVTLNQPGHALIHLGQHVHGVNHVGEHAVRKRTNLILWFFGPHDYVHVGRRGDNDKRQRNDNNDSLQTEFELQQLIEEWQDHFRPPNHHNNRAQS